MKITRLLLVLLALAVTASVPAGCGSDDDAATPTPTPAAAPLITRDEANAGVSLKIGSKDFTEQRVLGEIFAQGLAAAGYDIDTELNLGDEQTALKAIESGTIDAYPEYTGTALLSFFGVEADALPKDPTQAYEQAKEGFTEKNLTAFEPTPFTSSNEVAVTQDTATEMNLKTISDLKPVAGDLTMYGSPECRQRLDCLLGLQTIYGLKFKKFVPVDIALRHEVLTKGQADVSIVFTTDPQIEREQFVLLEDDKGMFPPYNSTLVMRNEIAEQGGAAMEELIAQVNEGLTDEAMQELNARVDLDKKTPEEVAGEYLSETGLVE